jgi:hypothetical protein
MNKEEINQAISLFNLDVTTKNYCDSWDLLIPVYQLLVRKTKAITDIDSKMYLNHCIATDLEFDTMNNEQFAIALHGVILEYYSETTYYRK